MGGKGLRGDRERGDKIVGGKRENILGWEKALGGTGGKGSQQGKGGKHLREEKGEDLGGERP